MRTEYIYCHYNTSLHQTAEKGCCTDTPPCLLQPFGNFEKGRCHLKPPHISYYILTGVWGRGSKAGVRGPLRITLQMPGGPQTPGWEHRIEITTPKTRVNAFSRPHYKAMIFRRLNWGNLNRLGYGIHFNSTHSVVNIDRWKLPALKF